MTKITRTFISAIFCVYIRLVYMNTNIDIHIHLSEQFYFFSLFNLDFGKWIFLNSSVDLIPRPSINNEWLLRKHIHIVYSYQQTLVVPESFTHKYLHWNAIGQKKAQAHWINIVKICIPLISENILFIFTKRCNAKGLFISL